MPGRVRFRIPSLRGDAKGEAVLEERLAAADGIESVVVNRRTASLLIRFDPDRVEPRVLVAAVARLLGLETEMERPPVPALARELRDLGGAVNRAVYERTGGLLDAWTAALVLIGALGVREAMRGGGRIAPAGITMLWWAVNGVGGRREL